MVIPLYFILGSAVAHAIQQWSLAELASRSLPHARAFNNANYSPTRFAACAAKASLSLACAIPRSILPAPLSGSDGTIAIKRGCA